MAVGIIVGTAFTAIVTSLVADVITPLIGIIMGGIDFTELSVTFKSFIFPEHNVVLNYGNFIQSIVRFFIIAVCVFFMVKAMNAFRRKRPAEEPKEPKIDEKIALLTEIRDLLKERNGDEVIPHSDPSENKSSD
ncbi:MAG: large conductance mechanosensitive channel protein MscL [Oscillospiraceae bacterium]|nr:large conductance mechanosensitive channel protein MscL [Oscillospiraceae bacterium]